MSMGNQPRCHPKPGPEAREAIERTLQQLRSLIYQQGYTQLKVQDALGWGRTYVSQLLRQQKSLRLDQVLQILQVIEVPPADFFFQLYGLPEGPPDRLEALRREAPPTRAAPWRDSVGWTEGASATASVASGEPSGNEILRLPRVLSALVELLEAKDLVCRGELARILENHEFHAGTATREMSKPATKEKVAP